MIDDHESLKSLIVARGMEVSPIPFVLRSGRTSPLYFDLKRVLLSPEGAGLIARAFFDRLEQLQAEEGVEVSLIGGVATGAIPIVATMVTLAFGEMEGFYVQKQTQKCRFFGHVEIDHIEGHFTPQPFAMVEDVITEGGSIKHAIEAVEREHHLWPSIVMCVIDRQNDPRAFDEWCAGKGILYYHIFVENDFLFGGEEADAEE